MLENAKVGQRAVRKMKNRKGETWEFNAEVLALNANKGIVTALVFVDLPRFMVFDISTGVNVAGHDYGWLELVPA